MSVLARCAQSPEITVAKLFPESRQVKHESSLMHALPIAQTYACGTLHDQSSEARMLDQASAAQPLLLRHNACDL